MKCDATIMTKSMIDKWSDKMRGHIMKSEIKPDNMVNGISITANSAVVRNEFINGENMPDQYIEITISFMVKL